MTTVLTFDTQQFVDTLREANFSEEQAKGLSKAMKNVFVESNLVTNASLDMKLKELEYRLTLRMGAMFATTIVLLSALYKLFG